MYNKVTYSFMFNIQSCFGCNFTNLKFSCAEYVRRGYFCTYSRVSPQTHLLWLARIVWTTNSTTIIDIWKPHKGQQASTVSQSHFKTWLGSLLCPTVHCCIDQSIDTSQPQLWDSSIHFNRPIPQHPSSSLSTVAYNQLCHLWCPWLQFQHPVFKVTTYIVVQPSNSRVTSDSPVSKRKRLSHNLRNTQ